MGADSRLVPALSIHARHVAAHLREADRRECLAGGADPRQEVLRSLSCTPAPRAMLLAGEAAAVLGIVPLPEQPRTGVIWLLGTNRIGEHGKTHTRLCLAYIAEAWRDYDILTNYVHAENTTAVRWLARLGFCIHPATPHPRTGEPFHLFGADKHVFPTTGPGRRAAVLRGVRGLPGLEGAQGHRNLQRRAGGD